MNRFYVELGICQEFVTGVVSMVWCWSDQGNRKNPFESLVILRMFPALGNYPGSALHECCLIARERLPLPFR